ncbi:MAG: chemotaxis protein CheW [Gammaproteobacteria bacterium]|nr:chemotaxis protein CheW [Gammaproteobacteria bacterium]
MADSGSRALALLQDIESRSRQKALGLPQQLAIRKTQAGIGFYLQDMLFVAATNEVSEILPYPSLTYIPGTTAWVKGIANIRGMLIPIIDLFCFVTGELTNINRKSRILVFRHGDLISGLLVSEVLGLRHFFDEERTRELPDVPPKLKSLLVGGYQQADQHWGIFSTRQLAETAEFLEVAGNT